MKKATLIIIITTAALLIGWDIYAYLATGPSATISQILLQAAGRHPVILLLAGFLGGHLFWPQVRKVVDSGTLIELYLAELELTATKRSLERWKRGTMIESDFVCEDGDVVKGPWED